MSTSVLSGIGIKTHLDTEYIINKIFNLSGFEKFSKSGFIEEVDNLFRRIKVIAYWMNCSVFVNCFLVILGPDCNKYIQYRKCFRVNIPEPPYGGCHVGLSYKIIEQVKVY